MKDKLTDFCRLISELISKSFRKSQNKKPTIVKNKIGFKLNLGPFQLELSKEWSSLTGENTIFCGDAGSSPALHSFYLLCPEPLCRLLKYAIPFRDNQSSELGIKSLMYTHLMQPYFRA